MKFLAHLFACVAFSLALASVAEEKAEEAASDGNAETNDAAVAEKPVDPAFERYRTIMDRMPFGREPPGFNPDAPSATAGGVGGADGGAGEVPKSEEEQRIISSVRVSVLNVTPSGKVAVGFTDSSKQPTANYYLKVGESRDGWTVVEADAAEQTVKLSHDGVEAELKLGEGSGGEGKGGGAKGKAPALAGLAGLRGRPGLMHRRPGAGPAAPDEQKPSAALAPGSALMQLRERRQRNAAEQAAENERRAKAADEEKQERERAAAERQQQLAQLQQIQEELARQREEKAARNQEAAQEQQSGGGEETATDQ